MGILREILWSSFGINLPQELMNIIEQYALPSIIKKIYYGPCNEIMQVNDDTWLSKSQSNVSLHKGGEYMEIVNCSNFRNITGCSMTRESSRFLLWALKSLYVCDSSYPEYPVQTFIHATPVLSATITKHGVISCSAGSLQMWWNNQTIPLKTGHGCLRKLVENTTHDMVYGIDDSGVVNSVSLATGVVSCIDTRCHVVDIIIMDGSLVSVSIDGSVKIGNITHKFKFGPILGICKINEKLALFWTSQQNIYSIIIKNGILISLHALGQMDVDGLSYDGYLRVWYKNTVQTCRLTIPRITPVYCDKYVSVDWVVGNIVCASGGVPFSLASGKQLYRDVVCGKICVNFAGTRVFVKIGDNYLVHDRGKNRSTLQNKEKLIDKTQVPLAPTSIINGCDGGIFTTDTPFLQLRTGEFVEKVSAHEAKIWI